MIVERRLWRSQCGDINVDAWDAGEDKRASLDREHSFVQETRLADICVSQSTGKPTKTHLTDADNTYRRGVPKMVLNSQSPSRKQG